MLAGLAAGAFAVLYLFSGAAVLFGVACAALAGALLYGGNWLLNGLADTTAPDE